MNLDNSMVVGAQREYEAQFAKPEVDLMQLCIDLEIALAAKGELPPIIEHAREHILDCALDDYEVIERILMESLTDQAEAGLLISAHMSKHVREYAEGHMSTLIEYFYPADDAKDVSALLKEQAA